MTRVDTTSLPWSVGSLHDGVRSSLWEALVTATLVLYFPLLFVLVVGSPVVLTSHFGLQLELAIQASLVLGALGYLLGFRVLFR